jgi:hypothetical protein
MRPEGAVLLRSLVVAPLFSVVASLVPVIFAVNYDPATTLREE